MSLFVQKPGILTTIQDGGRTGSRSLGINPSGAMDRTAMALINLLLGNDENEAMIEMHFPAGEFVFEVDCSFAVGGADLGAVLNGIEIANWSSAIARRGDRLRFSNRQNGNRAYLAVAGGFSIPEWLGSKSTNIAVNAGGIGGRRLQAGDRIGFLNPITCKTRRLGPSMIPKYNRFPTVRVIAGAEFEELTALSERAFLNEGFKVTNESNRMGFRLSGMPISLLDTKEMVSAAVTFGTIQLLPDGQMIVLMADHQTAGGYPRIANVISADLPLVAQLGPGDGIGFRLVSIDDAESLLARREEDIRYLKVGISLNV